MEPANKIISALGGTGAVARILGVHRTRVWKYTQPREKGGTGGLIPLHHIRTLLAALHERGLPFTAEDFLPGSCEAAVETTP